MILKKNSLVAYMVIISLLLCSIPTLAKPIHHLDRNTLNEQLIQKTDFSFDNQKQAIWDWVDVAGGSYGIKPSYGIAMDSQGYLYAAGSFYQDLFFYTANETIVLSALGQNDIFIVKYTQNGECLWAKQAGGTNHDEALAITIDSDDNIIITGYFFGVATFDDVTVVATGVYDIFIAKYNSDGVLQWIIQEGGYGLNTGYCVSTDSDDNIIIAGRFGGTAFGSTANPLVSYGNSDGFVAKYSPNGVLQWARQAGGKDSNQVNAVALDSSNNIYITGFFNDIAFFSGGNYHDDVAVIPVYSVKSNGLKDIFVAAYTPNGKLLWVRSGGGQGNDQANSIATDDQAIYITGSFQLSATFDEILLPSYHPRDDCFILIYSMNGSVVSAEKIVKQSGQHGLNLGRKIAIHDEYFYILGSFKRTIGFNNGMSLNCNTNIHNIWSYNAFIVKYDSEWNAIWVKQVGSMWDHVFSFVIDDTYDVYVTGSVSHIVDFDGLLFTGLGAGDFFIAKLTEL